MKDFNNGLKDSLPIAMGYFAVSFSFGILAVKNGIGIFPATLTSLTNVTSAGQFAGIGIIAAGGTIMEMILTQFIINLRYALMSLALSQKLSPELKTLQRLIIAFANTDEIFAVAIAHNKNLTLKYMMGLQIPAVFGWTFGTFTGAFAGNILPLSVISALSIALYGMFVAIVVPAAKKSRSVLNVVIITLILSCIIYYVPFFDKISFGVAIIISTVLASAVNAVIFPIKNEEGEKEL